MLISAIDLAVPDTRWKAVAVIVSGLAAAIIWAEVAALYSNVVMWRDSVNSRRWITRFEQGEQVYETSIVRRVEHLRTVGASAEVILELKALLVESHQSYTRVVRARMRRTDDVVRRMEEDWRD